MHCGDQVASSCESCCSPNYHSHICLSEQWISWNDRSDVTVSSICFFHRVEWRIFILRRPFCSHFEEFQLILVLDATSGWNREKNDWVAFFRLDGDDFALWIVCSIFILVDCKDALWARTTKNTDWSTGPLARPFAHTAHSFACSALLALLACSTALTLLTPLLVGE